MVNTVLLLLIALFLVVGILFELYCWKQVIGFRFSAGKRFGRFPCRDKSARADTSGKEPSI